MLSAQIHMWTKTKSHNLALYNKCLQNFRSKVSDFPELNFKVEMYETIIKFTTNRNPIKTLNPISKNHFVSKSNQEAFQSINFILKKFNLQILD